MKLAYSSASPYVRKVTACAIKRGIDKQIERMKISTTDPELLKYNALSKVPRYLQQLDHDGGAVNLVDYSRLDLIIALAVARMRRACSPNGA